MKTIFKYIALVLAIMLNTPLLVSACTSEHPNTPTTVTAPYCTILFASKNTVDITQEQLEMFGALTSMYGLKTLYKTPLTAPTIDIKALIGPKDYDLEHVFRQLLIIGAKQPVESATVNWPAILDLADLLLVTDGIKKHIEQTIIHIFCTSSPQRQLTLLKKLPAKVSLPTQAPTMRSILLEAYIEKVCHIVIRTLTIIDELPNWISQIIWSPNSALIAITSQYHSTPILYDAATGICSHILNGHMDNVESLAWDHNSRYIATGSDDHTAKIWYVAIGALKRDPKHHTHKIRQLHSWSHREDVSICTLTGHTGKVTSVAWDSQGRRLATASFDHTAKIWNALTGDCIRTFTRQRHACGSRLKSITWSPDDARLTATSCDHAQTWNTSTGDTIVCFDFHMLPNAVSPDNTLLAAHTTMYAVHIWSLLGAVTDQIPVARYVDDISSITWNPDSTLLATGCNDGTIRIWNVRTNTCTHTLTGHTEKVVSIAWNSDSTQLATTSVLNTIKIWSILTDTCIHTITWHRFIAWSPDNTRFITFDKKVQIWCHPNKEQCLGKIIADACADKTTHP